LIVPALAAWVLSLSLGRAFIAASAPTYDEPVHLASGYAALRARPLNWRDHPPFAEAFAALPLLRLNPAAMPQAQATEKLYDFADLFLYKNTVDARRLLDAARVWSLAVWMALLLAVISAWAFGLGGAPAAAGACAAAALMPPLVSNAALVTTDAAPTALYALGFFLLSRERRPAWLWAAAGAALGLAMAAKFSLFAAPFLAVGALLSESRLRGAPRARPAQAALMLAAAAAALWLVYRSWGLGLYWNGLSATAARLQNGRPSFLAGRRSLSGFWPYFPAALLLKTPAPSLLLAAGAAAAWLRRPSRAAFWVLFPSLAFFALACGVRTQLGVRYVLQVYPFLCVAAGCGFGLLWTRGVFMKAAAAALLAWQAWSVSRAAPDLLAYFGDLAGGPAAGVRWLGDSNLDWGQGLEELGAELKRRGSPVVYLSYFGSADPSYYGIRYLPVGWITNVARRQGVALPEKGAPVLLAVSATNLQGIYFADQEAWSWLFSRRPVFAAGHALFLYDLTADADGRARLSKLVAGAGFASSAKLLVVQ
jgi:hypothetical protein